MIKKIVACLYLISLYGTLTLVLLIKFGIIKISFLHTFLILAISYFFSLIGEIYVYFFTDFGTWKKEDQRKHIKHIVSSILLLILFSFGIFYCLFINQSWRTEIASF